MKLKITGIFLLFCLVAPVVTTSSWLHFQKIRVRREVKIHLQGDVKKEELILFTFSKEETACRLSWKDDGEFEYEGQMFDVEKREIKGDSILLWCWWDRKETSLNKQLKELLDITASKNSNAKESRKRLLTFYLSLYCSPSIALQSTLADNNLESFSYLFNWKSIPHTPPGPPPKAAA